MNITIDSVEDHEIAESAAQAIEWLTTVPEGAVKVAVRNGRVRLEGAVERWTQKSAAEEVVRDLPGVRAVSNMIALRPARGVSY